LTCDIIIYDCQCYNNYAKNFLQSIIVQKRSYFACIFGPKGQKIHQSFPILLGSAIDLHIRKKNFDIDPKMFGAIIVEGEFKVIPNYLTNNVNNLVVYKSKNKKEGNNQSLFWHIKHNNNVYLLRYDNNKVILSQVNKTNEFNIKQEQFKRQKSEMQINWVNWLNNINPFKHVATEEEYVDVFKNILSNYPDIDDLANKVIITAPVILRKVYDMTNDCKRLKSIYTTGNMSFVLSKKSTVEVNAKNTNMSIQKDYTNIWIPIDGTKQDKILNFIPYLKKIVLNHQVNNNNALKYPSDAEHFICTLSCKEMKDAGVTLSMAQYIIVSSFVDYEVIANWMQQFHNPNNKYRLLINGFITPWCVNFEIEDFKRYKRELVDVVFSVFGKYLYLFSIDNVPLKYSSKYKICLSPREVSYFPDAFSNYTLLHKFSNLVSNLPDTFVYTQPTKNVTALNNIKGSCNANINGHYLDIFLNAVGYNTGMQNLRDDGDYTHLAILSKTTNMPDIYKRHHNRLNEKILKLCTANGIDCSSKNSRNFYWNNYCFDPDHEITNKILQDIFLMKMPIPKFNAVTNFKELSQKTTTRKRKSCGTFVNDTGSSLIANQSYNQYIDDVIRNVKVSSCKIKLYCAFALEGETVEDGFVVDKDVVKNGPKKIISITLPIKFKKEYSTSISRKMFEEYKIRYQKINKLVGSRIYFGTLSAQTNLSWTQNRKVEIIQHKISDVYYYDVFFNIESLSSSTNYNITSHLNNESVSLLLHFDYCVNLGIGSKICTLSGRKGVISGEKDLSAYAGYDANGNWVKPQLIISPIVPIANSAAGLVYDMFLNEKRAVTKDGGLIAPLEFTAHYIEPSTKLSNSTVRNDAMTNQNGFDSNSMSITSLVLSRQMPTNNVSDNKRLVFMKSLLAGRGVYLNLSQ